MKGFLPNKIEIPKEGIPFENVSTEIDKEKEIEITCCICKNLIWDQIDCKDCGKLFCKFCLNKSLKKLKNSCPMCRSKPFKSSNCKALKITFLDIKLKCPNNGCKENPKYHDYISHLKKCEFKKYHCINKNCKYENSLNNKEDMESHLKSCEFRMTKCDFCGKEMVANLLEKHHEEDCPKFIIKCENCLESMTRDDYNNNHSENICLKNQIKLLKNQINQNEDENNNEIFVLKNEIIELKNVINTLLKNSNKPYKEGINCEEKIENEISFIQKKRNLEKEE